MKRSSIFKVIFFTTLICLFKNFGFAQEGFESVKTIDDYIADYNAQPKDTKVKPVAQHNGESKNTEAKKREKKIFKLDDIVITATQYEKTAFDTPIPVTIINREEIDKISPSNIGDLLKNVPGIEIHHDSTPGISKARIRGLSANRVVILIDGKRWNSHVSSLTGGVYLNEVDVNQIEKIEILHGPGTVLYGSGAIGGVINIITKKTPKSTEKYFNAGSILRYGSVNEMKSVRVEAEFGVNGFHSIIGVSKKGADDVNTPEGKLEHSNYKDTSIDIRGGYVINDKQSANFSVTSFRGEVYAPNTKMKNIPMEIKDIIGNFDLPTMYSNVDCIFDIPQMDRDAVALDYDIKKPFSWLDSFTLSAHAQKEMMNYINTTTIRPYIMPGNIGVVINGDLNTDTYSAQAKGISRFDYGFSQILTFGMGYSKDKAKAPSIIDTNISIMGMTLPNQTLQPMINLFTNLGLNIPENFTKLHTEDSLVDGVCENIGFYLQDEIELFEDLWMTLGGRFDYFKAMDNLTSEEYTNEAVTGGIGLLYSLTDFINLAGSATIGFRSPSLEERFYVGAVPGGALLMGNPDIKSEESINYEAGIKMRYSNFSGNITGYYNRIDNYILMAMSNEFVNTFANKGKVEIYGIEGNFDYQISQKYSVFSSMSYVRGEDKIGKDPLEGIPPFKTILGLRYSKDNINLLKNGKLWAEICAKVYAKQNRIPDEWTEKQKTPAFTVYDFRMGIDIPSFNFFKGASLTFAIENFTDKAYKSFPMICMHGWDDSIIQPGRNFLITLNLKTL